MKNKENLYPGIVWTHAEVVREIVEVESELKNLFPYIVLQATYRTKDFDTERITVKTEIMRLPGHQISEIFWKYKKASQNALREKEKKFLDTYMNFRNRELKRNQELKDNMQKIATILMNPKDNREFHQAIKSIYNFYVPTKKEREGGIVFPSFEDAFMGAFTVCMSLNYSKMPNGMIVYVEERIIKMKKCMEFVITRRKKAYVWSECSAIAMKNMSEMNLSLAEMHMADFMRSDPRFIRCIHCHANY